MEASVLLARARRLTAAATAQTATPSTRAAQDGFVPVENLPQQDTIPAPRLVATAYALRLDRADGYLYSIWRRLGTVRARDGDGQPALAGWTPTS